MGHSMENINWTKVGLIGVALLVGAWVAVSVFNVSLGTLGTLAFLGFFVWMHMGMHGGHDSHGEKHDDSRGDGHAAQIVDSTRDGNARTIAPDPNARGLASDGPAKTVKPEESSRHHGC